MSMTIKGYRQKSSTQICIMPTKLLQGARTSHLLPMAVHTRGRPVADGSIYFCGVFAISRYTAYVYVYVG